MENSAITITYVTDTSQQEVMTALVRIHQKAIKRQTVAAKSITHLFTEQQRNSGENFKDVEVSVDDLS